MTALRRALLFTPGDDRHKIEKGAASGADAVILDLEDGVAYSRKEAARQIVAAALHEVDFGKTEKLVRINEVGGPHFQADLDTTIEGKPDGYVLPKVESAEQVQKVAAWLDTAELSHQWSNAVIRLLVLIESARGLVYLREIASASSRLDALIFGAEDYVGSVGATRSVEGMEVFYARSVVVAHAAAFGLQAIDTPFVKLHDPDRLHQDAALAAQLGYTGKLAIHPEQIEPLKTAFSPSPMAVAYARQVMAAFGEQQARGTGAFALEGQMIDEPMARAARTVIARARTAGLIVENED